MHAAEFRDWVNRISPCLDDLDRQVIALSRLAVRYRATGSLGASALLAAARLRKACSTAVSHVPPSEGTVSNHATAQDCTRSLRIGERSRVRKEATVVMTAGNSNTPSATRRRVRTRAPGADAGRQRAPETERTACAYYC